MGRKRATGHQVSTDMRSDRMTQWLMRTLPLLCKLGRLLDQPCGGGTLDVWERSVSLPLFRREKINEKGVSLQK